MTHLLIGQYHAAFVLSEVEGQAKVRLCDDK